LEFRRVLFRSPGILNFRYPNGQVITRPVQIIGVRPQDRANTGDFAEFLFDDRNQKIKPSFEVTQELKMNSPRAGVMNDLGDDPMDKLVKDQLKKQIDE